MATMVPDRGDNPKRRVKYSDMTAMKDHEAGAYNVYHRDAAGDYRYSRNEGTKRQAMKHHKDMYEGN